MHCTDGGWIFCQLCSHLMKMNDDGHDWYARALISRPLPLISILRVYVRGALVRKENTRAAYADARIATVRLDCGGTTMVPCWASRRLLREKRSRMFATLQGSSPQLRVAARLRSVN